MGTWMANLGFELNENHLGYILAWTFCSDIMVYNPYQSMAKPFIGKFEGHNGIIVDCRLMNHTPCCVSVDEKKILKIWSILDFSAFQTVSLEFIVSTIKLVSILPDDSFLVASRKISYYHNLDLKNQLALLDQSQPVRAVFSDHYKNFMVLTKHDMRVFSPITGKLQRVFTNIAKQDSDYFVQVSSFCVGARNRKFYLGDSEGYIRMFNLKNGQLLKTLNDPEDDYKEVEKLAQVTFNKMATRIDRRVTCVEYLHDEKILISAANSVIYLHDEIDAEECELIRVFIGGHEESEISSLKYLEQQSILFSGSDNGLISVWDLENAKHLTVLLGHTCRIVSISLVEGYSALLTVSADGHVCIWKLGGRNNLKYKLIARFVLQSVEKLYHKDRSNSVMSVLLWNRVGKPSEARLHPYLEKFTESALDMNPVSSLTVDTLAELYQTKDKPIFENKFNHSDFASLFFEDYEFAKELPQVTRHFLVLGTQAGEIFQADLLPYLKRSNLDESTRVGANFNHSDSKIRRKDHLAAQKSVSAYIAYESKIFKNISECYDLERSLCVGNWKAHDSSVISIESVHSTEYLLTSSADQFARVWTLRGDLNSSISMMNNQPSAWNFNYDWIGVIQQDFDQVFKVIETVQGRQISIIEREKVLNDHFISSFINTVNQVQADERAQPWKRAIKKKLLREFCNRTAEKMEVVGGGRHMAKKARGSIKTRVMPELDKVMAKSSNYQKMRTLGMGFQSSLAGELDKEFKVISKEEENKLIGSGFASISSRVLTQMRKPRYTKRSSVLFKNQGDVTDEISMGMQSNQNSIRLITESKESLVNSKRNIPRASFFGQTTIADQSKSNLEEEKGVAKYRFLAPNYRNLKLKVGDASQESFKSSRGSHFRVTSLKRETSGSRLDSHDIVTTSRWTNLMTETNQKAKPSPKRIKKEASDSNRKRGAQLDRYEGSPNSPRKLARIRQQSSFACNGLNEFTGLITKHFNSAEEEMFRRAEASKFSIIAKPLLDMASPKIAKSPGLNSHLMKQKIAEFIKKNTSLKEKMKKTVRLPFSPEDLENNSVAKERSGKREKSLVEVKNEVKNRMKRTASIIDGQIKFFDQLSADYGKASRSRIVVANSRYQSRIIGQSSTTAGAWRPQAK